MDIPGGDTTAGAGADPAQGAAAEVESQGIPSGQAAPEVFTVGDQKYNGAKELHQGALKWQGEFTRASQARAQLQRQYEEMQRQQEGYRSIIDVIRSDPRLAAEVRARVAQGQNPQQAAAQTAQMHPEVLQHLNALKGEVQTLQQQRLADEQDRAQYEFREEHKDVNDKEWHAMAEFIGQNAQWLQKAQLPPREMIELAYAKVVLPQRLQMAHAAGQQAKEEEIRKGGASRVLSSQAASAGARKQSNERPKGKLTPAQEREHANRVFASNKQR